MLKKCREPFYLKVFISFSYVISFMVLSQIIRLRVRTLILCFKCGGKYCKVWDEGNKKAEISFYGIRTRRKKLKRKNMGI